MIIFHIGSPRTGTTSIQHFLHHSCADLSRLGISLLPAGWSLGGHADLRRAMIILPHEKKLSFKRAKLSDKKIIKYLKIRNEFKKILAAPPTPHVLISTESFWTMQPKRLLAVFPELASHDCRVICSLRDPFDFTQSHYAQNIKSGRASTPIEKWFKSNRDLYHYPKIIQPWFDLLGHHKIYCYSFEKARQFGIVKRFLMALQDIDSLQRGALATLEKAYPQLIKQHSNITPNEHVLAILLEINKMKSSEASKYDFRQFILSHRHTLSSTINLPLDNTLSAKQKHWLKKKNDRFLKAYLHPM